MVQMGAAMPPYAGRGGPQPLVGTDGRRSRVRMGFERQRTVRRRPERGSISSDFSAHADGERRVLDRIGRSHQKGLGEVHL